MNANMHIFAYPHIITKACIIKASGMNYNEKLKKSEYEGNCKQLFHFSAREWKSQQQTLVKGAPKKHLPVFIPSPCLCKHALKYTPKSLFYQQKVVH